MEDCNGGKDGAHFGDDYTAAAEFTSVSAAIAPTLVASVASSAIASAIATDLATAGIAASTTATAAIAPVASTSHRSADHKFLYEGGLIGCIVGGIPEQRH